MGIDNSVARHQTSDLRTVVRKRFLIALLPPADVQAKATEIKGVMRDHYASKAAFRSPPHVTLMAPFDWPIADLPRLASTLSKFAAHQSPVPMTLDGFAAFAPHVIYINVVQSDRIMAIQADLLSYLSDQIGLAHQRDQNRAFVPHMTVAFRDLSPSMFRKAWSVFQHQEIHFDFAVGQLTLLIHSAQMWSVKEHYDFAIG